MVCDPVKYLEPEWEPWEYDLFRAGGIWREALRRKGEASVDLTAAILRARRKKVSVVEIARRLGVTRDAVYRRIRKANAGS